MAKRICRTADRFDPTGVPRPRCCVRRATPPSCTAVVHEVSQRDKDAFIFGEGCAGLARRQTGRDHSLPPGPGRAAPPICSDLIYDRHNILCNGGLPDIDAELEKLTMNPWCAPQWVGETHLANEMTDFQRCLWTATARS